MAGPVRFWWTYSLGPSTILYAFAPAVVAALIMGVLPGLKATGGRLSANLQELVMMTVVAMQAAIGPARRILRIRTVEALRSEG